MIPRTWVQLVELNLNTVKLPKYKILSNRYLYLIEVTAVAGFELGVKIKLLQ